MTSGDADPGTLGAVRPGRRTTRVAASVLWAAGDALVAYVG
ncbi:hypothetical protein OG905_19025 [Streptomyces sp. NBC_00322]|nr:hypothetical protein [Streptomyces sp. NBC_00322]